MDMTPDRCIEILKIAQKPVSLKRQSERKTAADNSSERSDENQWLHRSSGTTQNSWTVLDTDRSGSVLRCVLVSMMKNTDLGRCGESASTWPVNGLVGWNAKPSSATQAGASHLPWFYRTQKGQGTLCNEIRKREVRGDLSTMPKSKATWTFGGLQKQESGQVSGHFNTIALEM